MSVRLVQPLAEVAANGTPVQISVRGDIATALTFRSLPAVGLAVVGGSTVEGVERYLGAGIGAGFVGRSPLWSAYGLAGFRMPIVEGLAGAFELQLSTNRFTTGPRLGVALEYSFGADR